MTYLETVKDVYREAAEAPAENLCCVGQPPLRLPGLNIPSIMYDMDYGCGAAVQVGDLQPNQTSLYVGVGGGLEALYLAYYSRKPQGVIAVDPVPEMREAARKNFDEAAKLNDWFDPSFVDIRDGDALNLPIDDNTIDIAAQNCLFNIFKQGGDLEKALGEMFRVLKLGGRLVMSDPICEATIPEHLQDDERLRAACLSGCIPIHQYISAITNAGFGSVEIRSRKPYRILRKEEHDLDDHLLLESIEVAAVKSPMPDDGPCIFTGRTACFVGSEDSFDDGKGHVMTKGIPLAVCDKTAAALQNLNRKDIIITDSTWHYNGGGCC